MAQLDQAPRYEPLGFGPFAKAHAKFTEVDQFDWETLGKSGETYDWQAYE